MLSQDHPEHCDRQQSFAQVGKNKKKTPKVLKKNKHSGNGTFGDTNDADFLKSIQLAQGWK